jgi:hypothetical protein
MRYAPAVFLQHKSSYPFSGITLAIPEKPAGHLKVEEWRFNNAYDMQE